MYEPDDDAYGHEEDEREEIQNEMWQEACWIVISAYFDEKGEPEYSRIRLRNLRAKNKNWR